MNKAYIAPKARVQGFTLLEVLIAVAIMVIIAMASLEAVTVSFAAHQTVEEKLTELGRIERTWVLMENDLRNALGYAVVSEYHGVIPAMRIGYGEEYWLAMLRGGKANPLNLPRTELVRVAYRFVDETLWRDTWIDPANPDADQVREQKLMEAVEDVRVRVLSAPSSQNGTTVGSVSLDTWLDEWPGDDAAQGLLPAAVEVTLKIKGRGDLTRLFALVPGV